MKTLKDLLNSYKVVITPLPPEDGPGYLARYEELGYGVRGIGETPAQALADLEELALDGYSDVPLEQLPRPQAEAPWARASGRLTLRLPKMLHAKVERQAAAQGVSLNQWICQVLESATTAIDAGLEFGARGVTVPPLSDELARLRESIDVLSYRAAALDEPDDFPWQTDLPKPSLKLVAWEPARA